MAIWKQCQRGSLHCRTLKNKLLRVFVLKSSFPSTNINIGSIYLQLLLDNIKIQCQISVFHESRLSLQVHLRLEKVFWKHFRSCGRSLVGLMVWETQVALRCATPLSGRLCLFPKLVICWLYFFYSRAMLVFNRPSQVGGFKQFFVFTRKVGGKWSDLTSVTFQMGWNHPTWLPHLRWPCECDARHAAVRVPSCGGACVACAKTTAWHSKADISLYIVCISWFDNTYSYNIFLYIYINTSTM